MDDDSRKTIIMEGVFGLTGILIMLLRLAMRKYRKQRFNLSDYLTIAAIIFLATRCGLTTVVVLWGNNNLTAAYRASNPFTDTEIYQREIGSKLTIVNRIVYNTYIWIQKSVVLLLYRRMLNGLPFPNHIMNGYWVFLLITYLVVQVMTFVECHPFNLYWQVIPDPGICPQAPIQLITFVALNIATDLGLIIMPMPWLFRMKRSLRQRLSLIGLFSIGFLLIAIAFVRLPIYYGSGTSQVNRNTWGSVEAFAAAFVANVPTLFALRHRVPTPRDSVAMAVSQGNRTSAAPVAGFHQGCRGLGSGITVRNSIQVWNEAIADDDDDDDGDAVKVSHQHREFRVRGPPQASNESLVSSTHITGSSAV